MISIIGYTALPMSTIEVENEAKRILREYQSSALLGPQPVNVEWVIEQVLSEHGFSLELKPDSYFPSETEAVTDFQERKVYIRESTYEKLGMGDGRAKYTLAHECGHVVLHTDQWLQKLATAARAVDITKVAAFISPEWQANKFAAALLMPEITFWPALCELRQEQGRFQGFEVQELACIFEVSWNAVGKRIDNLSKRKGPLM